MSSFLGDSAAKIYGARLALVTSNQDPDGLGRVTLSYPWLGEQVQSGWTRIVSPMAGKARGLFCLPEVNDEVLVLFEDGDIDAPYVIGALWNHVDLPPGKNDDGKNNCKVLKSRSGHTITLDDTDGAEKIVIIDGSGKNRIAVDTKQGAITIQSDKNLTIQAGGDLLLKAAGKLTLAGGEVAIEAQQAAALKAGQTLALEAQSGMTLHCLAGIKLNDGALEVT